MLCYSGRWRYATTILSTVSSHRTSTIDSPKGIMIRTLATFVRKQKPSSIECTPPIQRRQNVPKSRDWIFKPKTAQMHCFPIFDGGVRMLCLISHRRLWKRDFFFRADNCNTSVEQDCALMAPPRRPG